MIARDLTGNGVTEATWQAVGLPARLPVLEWDDFLSGPGGRLVVFAPHPDDEVLGCGGILARAAAMGRAIVVVAVTDGEASHPGRAEWLRSRRAAERAAALSALGLQHAQVHRLGLPDGGVRTADVLAAATGLSTDRDVILAPWMHDGHPDHDAVGAAAAALPGRHWSYLVWAWHWADPQREDLQGVPWKRARRAPMDGDVRDAKRRAVSAYTSQLTGSDPILPMPVLDRLLRADEVLLGTDRSDGIDPVGQVPAPLVATGGAR